MQFPEEFAHQMSSILSPEEYEEFCHSLDNPPYVSVRPNPFKDSNGDALRDLDCKDNVTWSSLGKYLGTRPSFTLNPLFHSGAFYVQEASSMFLEQALRQCGNPKVVLDLCAAPGGKSTLLRSLLDDEALLVSNEPIKNRAQILAENIIKWGHEGNLVTCNFPKDFKNVGAVFDLIVVDAPCSGEGMFRKDNPALEMWSPANVEECAKRQRDIVETIWPSLKAGGFLVYSTCTYNTLENEQNIDYFCHELDAEAIKIDVPTSTGIIGNLICGNDKPVYHFMPHRTKGEGFFLALLQKKGSVATQRLKGKKTFRPMPKDWGNTTTAKDLVILENDNQVYAIRKKDADMVSHLLNALYPITMGLPLYEKKGNKTIPAHGLAMSRLLNKSFYPTIDLSLDQALDYLRRQAIQIDAKKGYILLTYKNMPLGFANNLGNRANNMYPANWKIKH